MRLIFLVLLVCQTKISVATLDTSCFCGQMQSSLFQVKIFGNKKKKYFDFSQGTIVGGKNAKIGEFPWAAFIQLSSSTTGASDRCAGSLINDR